MNNYLRVIIRNFISDKMYTFIIVFGLAIGIAASLMIAQYVHFELSFDRHYKDRDLIYFSYMEWQNEQGTIELDCHPAVAPLFKRSIPEVVASVRISPALTNKGDELVLRREENGRTVFYSREKGMYLADPDVLDFFSIPMLEGDSKTALSEPNTMVITRSLAEKMFPGQNPLDKTLRIQAGPWMGEIGITGIIENPMPNSSLQYNAFFSLDSQGLDEIWIWPIFQTFIKVQPGSNPEVIEKKINDAAQASLHTVETEYNIKESIHLFPFARFHFYRSANSLGIATIKFSGDKRLIIYFILLASLILIISWANYINLTTARALRRAKEVGLRKVNGATRKNLVFQFLIEFFFMNLISMLLALTIAQLLFSQFARIIGSRAEWIFWSEPLFWVAVALFTIFSTLASGIYPAFIMSNYNPSKVLKGNFSRSQTGMTMRKGLVLVQCGLSLFMILSIYVISRQLMYMQNKDMGMKVEQVLVVRTNELDTALNRTRAFDQWKAKVESIKDIKSTSAVQFFPGENGAMSQWFYRSSDPEQRQTGFSTNVISENYFNTLDMQLLYGRDFRDDQSLDADKVIINEKGAHQLGFTNAASAVGELITLRRSEKEYTIIGIVRDFNFSQKSVVSGAVFLRQNWNEAFDEDYDHFLIKLSTNNLSQSMTRLEKEWKDLFTDAPFDYFFLDTYFDTFYREEQQFAGVFGFFSILGILITCMGLFGLSLYDTGSRTKEIGIRKSLGGTATNIIWLFSKDYLKLVLTAGVLAVPISYWLLTQWLENYPDRIRVEGDAVLIPILLMLCIAMFTVGYQTFKAANVNPVESLKTE